MPPREIFFSNTILLHCFTLAQDLLLKMYVIDVDVVITYWEQYKCYNVFEINPMKT